MNNKNRHKMNKKTRQKNKILINIINDNNLWSYQNVVVKNQCCKQCKKFYLHFCAVYLRKHVLCDKPVWISVRYYSHDSTLTKIQVVFFVCSFSVVNIDLCLTYYDMDSSLCDFNSEVLFFVLLFHISSHFQLIITGSPKIFFII